MSIDPLSATADELLQALTVGDVAAHDPAVAARLAADAALQARWLALAETLADLRGLETGMRNAGGSIEAHVDAAAAVRAFRRRTTRRWWEAAVGVAAAALLALWLLRPDSRPSPDPPLGGPGIDALAPDGEQWLKGDAMRWSAVGTAAGYLLQVRETPASEVIVLPNGPTGEWIATNKWLPADAQRARLPARFEWRVIAYDSSVTQIATSDWATTWQ